MANVVLKIGGGVLKDKESFEKVVKIVADKQKKGENQIIVISALYGVTDFLINKISSCLSKPSEVEKTIIELKKIHMGYLNQISDKKIRENAEFILDDKISILEKFYYGISYLKEISPRSKDLVQSFGERLSPVILEAFLLDNNVKAKFVDAEEAGIVCKGNFENAYVDLEKTTSNVRSKVNPILGSTVILLPGYYGIDESGDVKTFGRGGTDYSAGFIANIFDAKLEAWKDVSGFMTADPKVVSNAKQIDSLSYDEAEELGYLGAKILHPKTIDPLKQKDLCVEIKNIFAPEEGGTIICSNKQKHQSIIKSVTAIKDLSVITVESSSMVNVPGFASLLFLELAKKEVSINLIVTSEASISFSVEPKKVKDALVAIGNLSTQFPCSVKVEEELALVAVVGEGLKETPGLAGRLFSALGKEKINIELISQGASEINISFAVSKRYLDKSIKIAHDEFIK